MTFQIGDLFGPELKFDGPTHVIWKGQRLLYLAGTDYHRLSFEPEVQQAVQSTLKHQGLSSGGSRFTTGNNRLLTELEDALANFLNVETTVIVGSGYLTNLIVLQALREEIQVVLADDQAHASLLDAVRAVNLPITFFTHGNPDDLKNKLSQAGSSPKVLVVTDGVFAARGEIAPLKEYWELTTQFGARLLIDDAHGLAVLGQQGKGSWERAGIPLENVYITSTLSKGFGVFGGVILADQAFKGKIARNSAALMGHTPMPVPVIAGAAASVRWLTHHRDRIGLLQQRSLQIKEQLEGMGIALPQGEMPVISIAFGNSEEQEKFARHCLAHHIFPPFNTYPGAPAGGHFRFVVTSRHLESDIHTWLKVVTTFFQSVVFE